jgi:predicted enzyme related to lactoylglutathione lyase
MDHTVVHFEIPADDPERAAEFYRKLLGWEIQKWEGAGEGEGYWMVSTVPADAEGRPARPGVNGGLMRRQHPDQRPVNYVEVEDVDRYAEEAVELGGAVVVPRTPVPGMGWFVCLRDTEGNVFGLWQPDPEAARAA